MDTVALVDPENSRVGDAKRGLKMDSAQRKKLADISNLQQRFKPTNQDVKQKSTTLTTKEYVEKLHKENTELMKLLADRNKLIELSAMEIQKLRINFQKVQLQNLELAQANSQMLAELNSGKDRLKVLQHELGCKNGLLKARKFGLGEKGKRVTYQNNDDEVGSAYQDGQSSQADKENKSSNANRRKQARRNQSLGPPAVKAVHAKEEPKKKRPCSRRQSAGFKSKKLEAAEDSVEIDDDKFPISSLHDNPFDANGEMLSTLRDDPAEASGQTLSSLHDGPVDAKEEASKKRHCSRRQSARFKSKELESTEDSVEIDDEKFPVSSLPDNPVDATAETVSSLHDDPANASDQTLSSLHNDPADASGQTLSSLHDDPVDAKKNKRSCSRRQSARFKSKEFEATEDFFEIEDDKVLVSSLHDNPVDESGEKLSSLHDDPADASAQTLSSLHDDPVNASGQTLLRLSAKKDEENATLNSEAREFRRSSVGRPLRQAAEKVRSYKEMSIRAKMRRTE